MRFELRKLLCKPKQMIILICFILISGLSMFYQISNDEVNSKEYKFYYNKIECGNKLQNQEILEQLKKEIDLKEKLIFDRNDVSLTMSDVRKSKALYEQLRKEFEIAYYYDDWQREQINQVNERESISIFQKSDSYQLNVAEKIKQHYEQLHITVEANMNAGYGLTKWLADPVIDVLLLFVSFYIICILFLNEEFHGFLNFMRIQYNGKRTLFGAKTRAVWMFNAFLILSLYGLSAIVIGFTYGFPSLLKPCQSIVSLKAMPYELYIWQFLLLLYLCKWILLNFYSSMMQLFILMLRRMLPAIILFCMIQLSIIFLASFLYETNSNIYLLQISQLFHPEISMSESYYFSFFQIPIHVCWGYLFITIMTWAIWLVNKKLFQMPYLEHSFRQRRSRKKEVYQSCRYIEWKKIWKQGKGGKVLLFILIVVSSYMFTIRNMTFFEDVVYNHYIDTISPIANDGVLTEIQKEKAEFQVLKEQLKIEADEREKILIQSKLLYEQGLLRYEKRAKEILAIDSKLHIIKEDEARFLLENPEIHTLLSFFFVFFILCISYFLWDIEKKSRVEILRRCSGNYNQIVEKQKRYCIVSGILLCVLLDLAVIVKNCMMYGIDFLSFSTRECLYFYNSSLSLHIGGFLILQIVYHGFLVAVLTSVFFNGFRKIKNTRLLFLCSLLVISFLSFANLSKFPWLDIVSSVFYPNPDAYGWIGSMILVYSILVCFFHKRTIRK